MTVSMIACTVTAGRYRLGEKSIMKRGFIFGSFIVVHRFGTWDFPLGGAKTSLGRAPKHSLRRKTTGTSPRIVVFCC